MTNENNSTVSSDKDIFKDKQLRIQKCIQLKKYLLKGKTVFPIGVEYTRTDNKSQLYVNFKELDKYITAVNEYIEIIDFNNQEYLSNNQNFDLDADNIELENISYILLDDDSENIFVDKESVLEMVIKLREKYIQNKSDYNKLLYTKNLMIKIIYIIVFFISLLILLYSKKGLKKFTRDINNICFTHLNI
tara:strand:+ start:2832 stop:3401 length:570 start_codon:yes stop_codon:yes gene_type:complete